MFISRLQIRDPLLSILDLAYWSHTICVPELKAFTYIGLCNLAERMRFVHYDMYVVGSQKITYRIDRCHDYVCTYSVQCHINSFSHITLAVDTQVNHLWYVDWSQLQTTNFASIPHGMYLSRTANHPRHFPLKSYLSTSLTHICTVHTCTHIHTYIHTHIHTSKSLPPKPRQKIIKIIKKNM